MPSGYEDLTIAEIKEASSGWNPAMLAAALEYEQAHAKRKGAIAASSSALAGRRVIPDGTQEGLAPRATGATLERSDSA